MRDKEIRKYQMLVRVREFGAAYRDLFPATSVAGKLFAAVGEAADELKRHDSKDVVGRNDLITARGSAQTARDELRRLVKAIDLTAAVIEEPELGDRFHADLECSDEGLLSQASTFLEEAKPFVKAFVAHGLPANVLRQLQGAIETFERALAGRASGRDRRAGARGGIESTMKAAVHAVKRLNVIVPNQLADPSAVARWNLARRVVYGRVSQQPAAPAAPPDANKPAA